MARPIADERPAPSLVREAVFANSFKSFHSSPLQTGFRTSGFKYRTIDQYTAKRVGEEFLLNSRLRRFDREFELSVSTYFADSAAVMSARVGEEPQTESKNIALTSAVALRMETGEAIGRRRSHRSYTGESLRFDDLSTLIRCGGAVTGTADAHHLGGGRSQVRFRAAPSGGALYPIELHIAALKVAGLERGIYRYDPLRNSLAQTHSTDAADALLRSFAVGEDLVSLSRAGAVILLIGRPWRAMRKYGARGMRLVFFEAGAIAENIHLGAVALGLGTVDCGSVYEDEADEVLGLDGLYQTLVHTVIVGDPG